jgi:hypothetical protein
VALSSRAEESKYDAESEYLIKKSEMDINSEPESGQSELTALLLKSFSLCNLKLVCCDNTNLTSLDGPFIALLEVHIYL